MVIRHSMQLLEQLSELEERLQHWETLAKEKGLEIDSEVLLQVAYREFIVRKSGTPPLTS